MRLVLASASPRRLDLLRAIGVVPDLVRPADVDETPLAGELPRPYCARVARAKAEAIGAGPNEIVLAADTTVALGRRIMGKPVDQDQAKLFLRQLSGRRHRVYTAIRVMTAERNWHRVVASRVEMKRLSRPELDAYLASGEWQGKAGGYSIQGAAAAFIPWISGSYSAIVGLPLAETSALLQAAGWPLWSAT